MTTAGQSSLLTFRAGGELLSVDASAVREIVSRPQITRVPNAPATLEGVASIRGIAMPIMSVSSLRGHAAAPGTRVLVLDHEPPVGLLVDGVSSVSQSQEAAPIDLGALLQPALRTAAKAKNGVGAALPVTQARENAPLIGLLTFKVSGQEFALPLDQVQEALAETDAIAPLPRSDTSVVGTMDYRGFLLPVLSLEGLLSLKGKAAIKRRGLVVSIIRGRPVGLMVDELLSVLQVSTDAFDPVPEVISRRSSEAKISAICRLDEGRRLVSVLDAAQFIQGLNATQLPEAGMIASSRSAAVEMTDPFVVFRIGEQAFGLPATVVEEIVNRPDRLTKVPRAPEFIEGVMNLRGHAVPVIDQRSRFGSAAGKGERDRIIIVSLGELRAGFLVDEVSDVARVPLHAVTAAPELTEGTKLFDRVANLQGGQRIVLLIDPAELLGGAERQMLIALREKASAST